MPQVPVEEREAMTFEDIAKEIGISPADAWNAYKTGIAKLRRKHAVRELARLVNSKEQREVCLRCS
ncbi:MAG TPA: hypothetical protein VIW68_12705 [Candidatus Sulfotelmatobacter sp.]